MAESLTVIAAAFAVWALLATRLERSHIGAPVAMVLAGVAAGLVASSPTAHQLDTEVARQVAEVILAVLLFVDATEVRGGRLLGGDPASGLRLLLIALPISLAAATLLGLVLLPGLGWPALLVIACVVMPIDLAPVGALVRDRRLPTRVRSVLNVESGYNDGIISPIFLFALILAGDQDSTSTALEALREAFPFAVKAILLGFALGTLLARLMNNADHRGLMTGQSRRIAIVVAPLLAYSATVALDGNGFVAAFVAGIAFRYTLRPSRPRRDLPSAPVVQDHQLLEDVTLLVTMGMWFAFGSTVVLAFEAGIDWSVALFCLAALTLLRIGPVLLSLIRSTFTWRDRMLAGVLGPRGTTSIVFGLLAFNGLPGGIVADTALLTMVLCVLGSVVLHGIGSAVLARHLAQQDVGPQDVGQQDVTISTGPH